MLKFTETQLRNKYSRYAAAQNEKGKTPDDYQTWRHWYIHTFETLVAIVP